MNKNKFSRRKFLQVFAGFSIVPVLDKLHKFFPEINQIYTERDATVRAILDVPDDIVMEVIKGKKASEMISQVLQSHDAHLLTSKLRTYHPVMKESRVTSLSWADGSQNAVVISIPFTDPDKNLAVLQYTKNDSNTQTSMVKFLNKKDLTKARLYTVENGEVLSFSGSLEANNLGLAATTQSSTCTASILIQCLGLWGCSGYGLAVCAAALILCPFTIVSCFAVYTCVLYCGGAWSYCFCWACGC